jgi:hypothetical protein
MEVSNNATITFLLFVTQIPLTLAIMVRFTVNLTDLIHSDGLRHSERYGFGLIDANAAVKMAAAMKQSIPPVVTYQSTIESQVSIHSGGPATVSTKSVASDLIVEHVQVSLNVRHASIGDLQISLKSPSGTTSVLLAPRHFESLYLKVSRPGVIVGDYQVVWATFGPRVIDGKDYGEMMLPPNDNRNLCDPILEDVTLTGIVLAYARGCRCDDAVRKGMEKGAQVRRSTLVGVCYFLIWSLILDGHDHQ